MLTPSTSPFALLQINRRVGLARTHRRGRFGSSTLTGIFLLVFACTPSAQKKSSPTPGAPATDQQASAASKAAAPPSAAVRPSAQAPASPEASTERAKASPTSAAPLGSLQHLEAFYEKVRNFEPGSAKRSLRVYFLGDSHTAADFMTERVRVRLQERLGDGGEGFVRVGSSHYRHEGVRFSRSGKWEQLPRQPAVRSRTDDGVLGYGGIRMIAKKGGEASLTWAQDAARSADARTIALQIRLRASDRLRISFSEQHFDLSQQILLKQSQEPPVAAPSASSGGADSGVPGDASVRITQVEQVESTFIVHFFLPQAERLRVVQLAGSPEIYGAWLEFAQPGAVLDTVGINGARLATYLAWDEEEQLAELRARQPDLVVLSFGTNEVFDRLAVERYIEQYKQAIGRIRSALPEVSCWIIGPTDAPDKDGGSRERVALISDVQEKVASELGCAFSSPAALMGGEGSFLRWMGATPRLAQTDRVHLSLEGYRKLGDLLADQLLTAEP